MTDALTKIRLGPDALHYIKKKLAEGKTLGTLLLKRQSLELGEVFTFLPPKTDSKTMGNFSRGGVLPTPPRDTHHSHTAPDGTESVMVPVPNAVDQLATTIREFLNEGEGRICLFESAVANPTDSFLTSPNAQDLRLLARGDDVYYFLTGPNPDPEKIRKTIKIATSYLVIGVLAELLAGDKFLPLEQQITRGEMTLDDLNLIVERTRKIIVGAYDGESYLIWTDG